MKQPHLFRAYGPNKTLCDVCLRTKGPHDRAWARYEAAKAAAAKQPVDRL